MKKIKELLSIKWMLMFATALMLSCTMIACGDDDDDDPSNDNLHPLTGYWTATEHGLECIFNFNKDATGFSIYGDDDTPDIFDDYKVENGHLLILWEGDNDYDDEGKIKISGNQFSLYDDYEDEWTIYTRK